MSRQDFYIRQLGIGPLWKLNEKNSDDSVSFSSTLVTSKFLANTNNNKDELSVVDVLIFKTMYQESQQVEILFEKILLAFQLNSKLSINVQTINDNQSSEDIIKMIQARPSKILAVFGVDIPKKLFNDEMYFIDESPNQTLLKFNHIPMFAFHSIHEILENAILKKTTWEKMCTIKNSFH